MRKIVWWGFVILIIALLVVFTLPRISDSPMKYEMTAGLNNCRLIHLAIQQYYLDQKAEGSSKPIQQPTISLLFKQNYIDRKFFDKIQQGEGTYVIYFTEKPAPSDILVQYFCIKGIAEMSANGDGHLYTWQHWQAQQGAAANP